MLRETKIRSGLSIYDYSNILLGGFDNIIQLIKENPSFESMDVDIDDFATGNIVWDDRYYTNKTVQVQLSSARETSPIQYVHALSRQNIYDVNIQYYSGFENIIKFIKDSNIHSINDQAIGGRLVNFDSRVNNDLSLNAVINKKKYVFATLADSSIMPEVNLNLGLVGAWNFDGSVNANFGSISCVATGTSFVTDGSGQAVKNSGTGYINGTSPVGFALSTVSIAMRVRIDTSVMNSYLIGKMTFGNDNNYAIINQYFGTEICFYGSNFSSSDSQATEITGAVDGQYHYIVYTYDGVTLYGYLDGVMVVSALINIPMVPSAGTFRDDLNFFTFDQVGNPGQFTSNSTISNTYIYNRVLTPAECARLAQGVKYPF